MGFFSKNNGEVLTPRQQLEAKFHNARTDLLLIVALTVINLVLLVTGSDTYFVFSAYIPYGIAVLGMVLCGKFPAEYYGEEMAGTEFFGQGVFVGFITVAVVLTLLYLLCWFLSKNFKSGWLIFALVMISVDTAFLLLGGLSLDSILDMLFHVWMIVTIAMGISANKKLKALPEEDDEPILAETENTQLGEPQVATSTAFKRVADMEVKQRVLCETELEGHKIVYRRVKRVNELVVDGYVYDEYEALVEFAHELSAEIGGHKITAGFDGATKSYIDVDGQRIAKKTRLY